MLTAPHIFFFLVSLFIQQKLHCTALHCTALHCTSLDFTLPECYTVSYAGAGAPAADSVLQQEPGDGAAGHTQTYSLDTSATAYASTTQILL